MTKEQLENWLGSDNLGSDGLLNLILELANNNYPIDVFNQDVKRYE